MIEIDISLNNKTESKSCTESEKPCQRVSNADEKVLQIRKLFATWSLLKEEFLDNLQNVRMLYEISSQYAKCLDDLERVWMI